MTKHDETCHLPAGDPVQWVRNLETVWQAMDGTKAKEGYCEDAVLIYGANQRQSGQPLSERPAKWFAHASDLKINKTYVAQPGTAFTLIPQPRKKFLNVVLSTLSSGMGKFTNNRLGNTVGLLTRNLPTKILVSTDLLQIEIRT